MLGLQITLIGIAIYAVTPRENWGHALFGLAIAVGGCFA